MVAADAHTIVVDGAVAAIMTISGSGSGVGLGERRELTLGSLEERLRIARAAEQLILWSHGCS